MDASKCMGKQAASGNEQGVRIWDTVTECDKRLKILKLASACLFANWTSNQGIVDDLFSRGWFGWLCHMLICILMVAVNCHSCCHWVISLGNINTLVAVIILSSSMKP